MEFKHILQDIKNVKIQGAENVAKYASLSLKLIKSKDENYLKELKKAKSLLLGLRPTEPLMKNCLHYIFYHLHGRTNNEIKEDLNLRIERIITHIEETRKSIALLGASKIKDGTVVFTHCHSSTVMNILKKAKDQGKKFSVCNTETRPLLQGRKTAKELSDYGIPVEHFVDSAARIALKKSDLALVGFDAIDSRGRIYNKIGSELLTEAAFKLGVPVYFCGDSWKYDEKPYENIEERSPKEIWPEAPKKVKVSNYAFEIINPLLITGVITELGIFKPSVYLEELKRIHSFI